MGASSLYTNKHLAGFYADKRYYLICNYFKMFNIIIQIRLSLSITLDHDDLGYF